MSAPPTQSDLVELTLAWYREKLRSLGELLDAPPALSLEALIRQARRDIDQMLAENAPALMKAQEDLVGSAILEPATCRSCHRAIIWILTAQGRKSPCDARRLVITTGEGKTLSGYTSHFATCPHAAKHRSTKR